MRGELCIEMNWLLTAAVASVYHTKAYYIASNDMIIGLYIHTYIYLVGGIRKILPYALPKI